VEDVAQISRPFQIALGAVLLLALVWTFALHAHSSSPSEPVPASSPAPSAVSASAKHAKVAASARKSTVSSSSVHKHVAQHKTVAVHRTVVHSPQKTTVLTRKVVVGPTHKVSVTHSKTVTTGHAKVTVSHKAVVVPVTHAAAHPTVTPSSRSDSSASKHQRPAAQLAVEHELAQGKTVMLVFWNPHTSVDQEVHSQASALVSGSKGTVVMHSALASQVNTFGSITEVVRVYQTPTILIVNRQGVVSTLTGLTEVFALQQAVREAQHAGK
jgi:hypothetical protein